MNEIILRRPIFGPRPRPEQAKKGGKTKPGLDPRRPVGAQPAC